jgi:hypothetical protein
MSASPDDILQSCRVSGSPLELYRAVNLIELVEGITATQASTRWTKLKLTMHSDHYSKDAGVVVVSSAHIDELLALLKETPEKTIIMAKRGHAVDNTKVRELVLHMGSETAIVTVITFRMYNI